MIETENHKKIIQTIRNNPNKFNTLKLSRKVNMSYTQCYKIVKELSKLNIIEKNKISGRENRLTIKLTKKQNN